MDINSITSATNSVDKTQDVDCDAGLKAVGGGFLVNNGSVDVLAQSSYPMDADTWRVIAVETRNYNANWSVTAYVICL